MSRKIFILLTCAFGSYLFATFAADRDLYDHQREMILKGAELHFPKHGKLMETGEKLSDQEIMKLLGTWGMEVNSVGDTYRYMTPEDRRSLLDRYERTFYFWLVICGTVSTVVGIFAMKGGRK